MFEFINEKWVIENLVWEVFFGILTLGILKVLYEVFISSHISKKILKNNRPVQGKSTKAADIFLEIWKEGKIEKIKKDIFFSRISDSATSQSYRTYGDISNQYLKPHGLTYIDENFVKPIRNFRNSLVKYFTKRKLMKIDPGFYGKF